MFLSEVIDVSDINVLGEQSIKRSSIQRYRSDCLYPLSPNMTGLYSISTTSS
jgi:hypothetical protein